MPDFGSVANSIDNVPSFDVTKIPDLSSKVLIVTGANAGLGKETALQLAKHSPGKLYLSARSKEKYEGAVSNIKEAAPEANVQFLEMDLSSLASVKKAADQILPENDRLDILINNAGIMGHDAATTKDGYEVHFGTNHLGPALFTRLLLPLLETAASEPDADVRIVNLSSSGHAMAPRKGIAYENLFSDNKSTHHYVLYGQSKLANVLHAQTLAERYPKITAVAVHPGRVTTALLDGMFAKTTITSTLQRVYDRAVGTLTIEQGVLNQLWGAVGNKNGVESGKVYIPVGKLSNSPRGGKERADQLWDWQEGVFKDLGYV